MIPTRKVLLFVTAAVLLLAGASGWCGEPQGRLELVVDPSNARPALGDAFDLRIRLLNSGQAPLVLYHPETIHVKSYCWSMSCRVTTPAGNEIVIEPEVTMALDPLERREHFRKLAPGDAVALEIRVMADDPSASFTPSGWVGVIPISEIESERLSEKAIKARYGIHGEIYFISGGDHWLAVRDLLGDVLNQPGKYRLEFAYRNECTQVVEFRDDGRGSLESVDGAWSGRLSESVEITIEE